MDTTLSPPFLKKKNPLSQDIRIGDFYYRKKELSVHAAGRDKKTNYRMVAFPCASSCNIFVINNDPVRPANNKDIRKHPKHCYNRNKD